MHKLRKYAQFILPAIGLILLLTACEVPDTLGPPGSGPRPSSVLASAYKLIERAGSQSIEYTKFPAQKVYRIGAGKYLDLESYHLSRNSKFGRVDIWVNGQLVRSEQAGGPAAFPDYLGEMQVLGWVDEGNPPEFLIFPSSTCPRVGPMNQMRRLNPVDLEYPAAAWSLCHTWIGLVPGTYELKMQATDLAGVKGEPIVQRIEVQ